MKWISFLAQLCVFSALFLFNMYLYGTFRANGIGFHAFIIPDWSAAEGILPRATGIIPFIVLLVWSLTGIPLSILMAYCVFGVLKANSRKKKIKTILLIFVLCATIPEIIFQAEEILFVRHVEKNQLQEFSKQRIWPFQGSELVYNGGKYTVYD